MKPETNPKEFNIYKNKINNIIEVLENDFNFIGKVLNDYSQHDIINPISFDEMYLKKHRMVVKSLTKLSDKISKL